MIVEQDDSYRRNCTLLGQHRAETGGEATRGEKRRVLQRLLPHPRNFPSDLSGVLGKVLAGIFLGLAVFGAARAEDAPAVMKPKAPEFVPMVVDQAQYQAAMTYLGGLKFNDAAPLVKWLNELEERAKGQWDADHAPKAAEVAK